MSNDNLIEIINYLLEGYRFGRYLEDIDLPLDQSYLLFKNNIHQNLITKSIEVLIVKSSNNIPQGVMIFRISDWDTNHFRRKTVIIDHIIIKTPSEENHLKVGDNLMNQFMNWCSDNLVKFVISKTPSLDLLTIHCLEKAGFRFIESWIYNKYDLQRSNPKPENQLLLRFAEKKDLNYMLEFSKDAFFTQRFHADFHISYEQAESLYTKWIRTSFDDPKQKILVYDEGKEPCAFMIYYIQDLTIYYNMKFAMWKMALLNPTMTGKGIGSRFFSSVCDFHRTESVDIVDSGLSLRNIVSLNTHNKLNFKVVSTLVSMHLWL